MPDLLTQYYKNNDGSTIFDLVVRLNNSPCHDKNCQNYIFEWVQDIQKLIPKANFRFILYFSHFYLEYQSSCSIGIVLEYQTQWIIDLVEQGVVVIFCPIVVSEMVPRPIKRTPNVVRMKEYDEMCLRNFEKLLKKLEARREEFKIFKSYNFSCNFKILKLDRFVRKPQYISIFPTKLEQFSKLPLKYCIPIVSKKHAKRVKFKTKSHTFTPKKDFSK